MGLRKIVGGLKSSDLPFLDAFVSQISKHGGAYGSPKLQFTPNLKGKLQEIVQDLINSSVKREIKASASSKVLISGAYLIIDPKNEGVVLSTDARFFSTIRNHRANPDLKVIRVLSPQFGLELEYKVVYSRAKD